MDTISGQNLLGLKDTICKFMSDEAVDRRRTRIDCRRISLAAINGLGTRSNSKFTLINSSLK